MTDPIYGDHPLVPAEWWAETDRDALNQDPEITAWRDVAVQMYTEFLESQWLMRWRRSITTAEGAQLQEWADAFSFAQPAGWAEDRFRAVLVAVAAVSFSNKTTQRVYDLANALIVAPQTFTFAEYAPLSARFTFLETSEDDAKNYAAALNRARPRGAQFELVAHPGGGGTPFTIGTSAIEGPDTLAGLFAIPAA